MLRLEHSYEMWPCQENCSYSILRPEQFLVNNQLDEQIFMNIYFYSLHVSEQPCAHHQENYCINTTSGLSLCVDDPLVCRLTCIPEGHRHRVIKKPISHWYNNSPDDGHRAARNRLIIEINIHEKLCVKLVIYDDHNKMHGQQNINLISYFSYLPQL